MCVCDGEMVDDGKVLGVIVCVWIDVVCDVCVCDLLMMKVVM